MHLLTLLLAHPYAFAGRQTRCLYSLLEFGSINSLFLGHPALSLGTLVWGWVAQEGWQRWKRAWVIYLLVGDAGALEGTHPQNMKMVLDEGSWGRGRVCWRQSCSQPPLKPSEQSIPLE